MRSRAGLMLEIAIAVVVFAVLGTRVPTVDHFLVNPDHGYQLAAGAELLRGRFPGVDVMINYGPMVAVLSALTTWATGNLVAEVLWCAAAWGAAVALAAAVARRNFGTLAGLATGGFAFLCVARFHKWYMWLLPLAALAVVTGTDRDEASARRWAVAGVIAGFGVLLRPEVGLASVVVLAVIAGADALRGRTVGWRGLALGFASPVLLWLVVVVVCEGGFGVRRTLASVPESIAGSVAYWSKAPPPFRWDAPFSPPSAHALALVLLPATEVFAVLVGAWLCFGRARGFVREGRTLAASGLMGLACYPHTVYRADIHHLWQGIWPLALLMPGLVVVGIRLVAAGPQVVPRVAAIVVTIVAATTAGLGTWGLAPILRQPHYDLAPYGRPPLAGVRGVARGVAAAPEHPYAKLVASIDTLSSPTDEVLVLVFAPQLLVFSARAANGPVVTFQRGLFDSPEWRRERLTALQRNPPALVVVPKGFWTLGATDDLRASVPEIYDFVHEHYDQIVDQRGNFMLLAPNPYFRAASP